MVCATAIGDWTLGSVIALVAVVWQSLERAFITSLDAGEIRVTTTMGFAAYRALVRDVVRRAPRARRAGLTDELLREPGGA